MTHGLAVPDGTAEKGVLPAAAVSSCLPCYVRLLLLCAAAACGCGSHANIYWALPLYVVSQGLDALDGHAARMLKQVSVLGACLDQMLDRLSTCLLYLLCSVAYPSYGGLFFCCLLADVGGHWLHFFSAAAAGAASHKQVDRSSSGVLHHYYTNRGLMFSSIVCYEGVFLCLLLAHAAPPKAFIHTAAICCGIACVPLAAFKVVRLPPEAFACAWVCPFAWLSVRLHSSPSVSK
ncbi:hypothetical protein Efla_003822 [Eimeria flavescens]